MRKLIERLLRAFRVPSIDEVELDYLNGAYDRVNLEYRQRQIEHGLFRPHYRVGV